MPATGCLKSVYQDGWLVWSSALGTVRIVCQQASECSVFGSTRCQQADCSLADGLVVCSGAGVHFSPSQKTARRSGFADILVG